ncbi:INO80 complex subunit E isoform X2 [Xyrichtys novacula]|uniref:INO80 complex subunit E isoform X2 n=1 Tax=Xyrichtys novacula TaxID=13765 RepID=A0AAV1FQ82_XYRNO|nr:INO80 complex subunit E isoform X2 [Xyrichtys novacula]
MNGQADVEVDYKRKYKNLKRKLKFLVYEQECFQEELRRAQRKLLKVSRDKSFLLDRLLQYERVDEDSSDSDATVSSENSEGEGPREREREREFAKKRRSSPGASLPSSSPHLSLLSRSGVNPLQSSGSGPYLNTVSIHLLVCNLSVLGAVTLVPQSSSPANIIPVFIQHYLYDFNVFSFYSSVLSLSLFLFFSLVHIMASLSLHCSCFVIFFLCVCVSVLQIAHACVYVCVVYLAIWGLCVLGRCPSHQNIWLLRLNE